MELNQKVLDYIKDCEEENYALIETLAKIPAPSGQEDLRVDFVRKWFLSSGASEVIVDEANFVDSKSDNTAPSYNVETPDFEELPNGEPLPF